MGQEDGGDPRHDRRLPAGRLPRIFVCLFGALSALGLVEGSYEWFAAGRSGPISARMSLVILGGGILLIAIPVVVSVLMLRSEKPEAAVAEISPTS